MIGDFKFKQVILFTSPDNKDVLSWFSEPTTVCALSKTAGYPFRMVIAKTPLPVKQIYSEFSDFVGPRSMRKLRDRRKILRKTGAVNGALKKSLQMSKADLDAIARSARQK